MPTRIIIADDHLLFRQGLKSLFGQYPNLQVVAEAATSFELDSIIIDRCCDLLLLDLQMDRWMLDEIPQLKRFAKIIVVTASESAENAIRALRAGARAVVQKRFPIEILLNAIQTVVDGGIWAPSEVQEHVHSENEKGDLNLEEAQSFGI